MVKQITKENKMKKVNCYICNEVIDNDWLECWEHDECYQCFEENKKMREWERSQMHPSELLGDY